MWRVRFWLTVGCLLVAAGGCRSHPLSATGVRLVAPLSTATVTSRRPTLRWRLSGGADGAHVEICRDRACSMPVTMLDADGSSAAPADDLPPGVLFWRAFARVGGVTKTVAATPTWQFTVGARSAPVDSSWGTTLDVNGDGYADLAVGAPLADQKAGRVYLYYGGSAGLAPASSVTLLSPEGGEFGGVVASAGDVNGDGFADLVFPVNLAPAGNAVGRVYLYFGGPSGPAAVPDVTLSRPGDDAIYFGQSAASAGDVNGDGYADLVVGAGDASMFNGRAYLYLGRASGEWGAPAAMVTGSGETNDHFAYSLSGAGDVDGDGYGDVIVGASEAHMKGAAYLFRGGPSGLVTTAAAELSDLTGGATTRFGGDVASAGDVNGDGYSDVLVRGQGASGGTANNVSVYLGGPSGLGTSAAVTLTEDGTVFGFFISPGTVAAAGDVDGDGYGDVVVGNPDVNVSDGNVYVHRGSATGLDVKPAITLASPISGQDFGYFVAGLGDVDGDGRADIAVALPVALRSTGQVYVYPGGAAGTSTAPALTIAGPDGEQGFFGGALASCY